MGPISSSPPSEDDGRQPLGQHQQTPSSSLSPPGAYPTPTLEEDHRSISMEPPLPPPSSSSASSSPTQPTFTWSTSARGTPQSEHPSSEVGLGPALALHSPRSAPTTPPIALVPRDPFDDGAVSFAHDPFAHDGSDPDDVGEDDSPPPQLLSSAAAGSVPGITGSSSTAPPAAVDDEEISPVDGEPPRQRSGTVSGLGLGQQGDRSTPTSGLAPDAYAYDASSSDSDPEDGGRHTGHHGQNHLPPPPMLVRAVSAPVQPARLGNLIHPSRRPSNSGNGWRPSFAPRPALVSQPASNFSAASDSCLLPQHRTSISGANGSELDSLLPICQMSASDSTTTGEDALSLPATPDATSASGLYVLTLELADSVQAAIQTLLQVTPPHLFDSAKEQFSACSVQMPATSLSSLLTAMKNLNYLSEHIAPLCADESLHGSPKDQLGRLSTRNSRSRSNLRQPSPSHPSPPRSPIFVTGASGFPSGLLRDPTAVEPMAADTPSTSMDSQMSLASDGFSLFQEFDVGEILQSVGDLLGGLMAEAGVDLVLYHGDVGMKHFSVRGDEGGICYVLSHVIRQILLVSKPGDAIEIGLHVNPQRPSDGFPDGGPIFPRQRTVSSTSSHSHLSSPSGLEAGNALSCTFEIIHNVAPRWDDQPNRTPMTEKAGTPNPTGADSFPGFTQAAGETLAAASIGRPPSSIGAGDIENRALLPPLPHLDSPLTQRLIRHVSATLRTDGDRSSIRRRFELSVLLERGSSLFDPAPLSAQEEAARQPFASLKLAREPTLAELMLFAETLRGKKVALHASETSAFARHITSYLTAWGMDMRHISTERDDEEYGNEYLGLAGMGAAASAGEGSPAGGFACSNSGTVPNIYSTLVDGHNASQQQQQQARPYETSPLAGNDSSNSLLLGDSFMSSTSDLDKDAGASFIMIDDDIEVLKRRLRQLRVQSLTAMPLRMKSKRPTLSSRARSSPHVRQLLTPLSEPVAPAKRGVIIVHFTSLANYSNVRDCVQSILSPGSLGALPEVIVIPKPVGPRRFLTALHTAVHRPMVDPFFTPIATSPLSPSGQYGSGYGYFPPAPTSSAPSTSSPTQKELSPSDSLVTGRPVQGRTVSSGSTTSTSSRTPLTAAGLENGLHLTIPRGAEPNEAFAQNARSGMLIQSPDGMPMGMFFDPAPRNVGSRRSSTRSETVGSDRRRSSTIVRPSIATYNASIDGLLKGSSSSGSRHSRAASLAESTSLGATSLSRRETMSRRSPASEPQHSPLDRSETTSPGATRVNRNKTPQTGSVAPGVLTHRPSSNSSSNTRPRTPNTEGVPPHVTSTSPKTTTAAALPRSPPPRPVLPDNEPEGVEPAPVAPAAVKKEKKARKTPKDDGVVVPPINVLIVEDNPINQTILSTFMKKRKIKYGVAKDGVEAVNKWRTGGFHLILMDIQLPVMDGIEATREIRRLEKSHNIGIFPASPTSEIVRTPSPSREVPPASPFRSSVIIVALTASSLQSDRVSALAAGCNDFLTKPVSLKWLEKKIVEWGCMQALIDFDGWRRWRGADKSETSDTARGFDAQAKALRSRLRIERRPPRSSSSVPPSGTATPPSGGVQDGTVTPVIPTTGPSINVTQPTPVPLASPALATPPPTNGYAPIDQPPSPIDDARVDPETQANVSIAGPEALVQQLEEVKLDDQRPTVLDGRQHSLQSIESVMLESTPRGQLPHGDDTPKAGNLERL